MKKYMIKNENIEQLIENKLNDEYIAGLIQADGSFSAPLINNGNKNSKKLYITPQINIVQHKDNRIVIDAIYKRFNYIGNIKLDKNNVRYKIRDLYGLNNIIIPIFNKAQLRDEKLINYLKFCFIVKNLIMLKEKGYNCFDYSLGNYNEYTQLFLDLIVISINMNILTKPSNNLRYLKPLEQELVLNNKISSSTKKELNSFINDFNINPLTNNFINGLFDGDGSLTTNITLNRHNNLSIIINYSIISNKYNSKLLNEIKLYFNNKGSLYNRDKDNTLRYLINKSDFFNIVLPKIYMAEPINNSINFNNIPDLINKSDGLIIKHYKIINIIYILILFNKYNNSNNNNEKLLLLNDIIINNYYLLSNYKKESLDDFTNKKLSKLSILINKLKY